MRHRLITRIIIAAGAVLLAFSCAKPSQDDLCSLVDPLIGSGGRHYRWQASRQEGEQQYITALNKTEKNAVICSILNDITGAECTFSADSHSAVRSDDGSDDAYLETIYATFGREPVDVVDEIK